METTTTGTTARNQHQQQLQQQIEQLQQQQFASTVLSAASNAEQLQVLYNRRIELLEAEEQRAKALAADTPAYRFNVSTSATPVRKTPARFSIRELTALRDHMPILSRPLASAVSPSLSSSSSPSVSASSSSSSSVIMPPPPPRKIQTEDEKLAQTINAFLDADRDERHKHILDDPVLPDPMKLTVAPILVLRRKRKLGAPTTNNNQPTISQLLIEQSRKAGEELRKRYKAKIEDEVARYQAQCDALTAREDKDRPVEIPHRLLRTLAEQNAYEKVRTRVTTSYDDAESKGRSRKKTRSHQDEDEDEDEDITTQMDMDRIYEKVLGTPQRSSSRRTYRRFPQRH